MLQVRLPSIAIGVAIYRGGVRLNLTRFFRVTGVVLVFVAAGLMASALHAAHDAGVLNAGQAQAVDLSWLVVPGTWTSSLLTGMLGLRPAPTVVEGGAYLAYTAPRRSCCAGVLSCAEPVSRGVRPVSSVKEWTSAAGEHGGVWVRAPAQGSQR